MLVGGVTVEYIDRDGRVRGAQVRVLDFGEPDGNDWLAVNQFTVVESRRERRPDIVLFVNGLPLAVIELKNPKFNDGAYQRRVKIKFPRSSASVRKGGADIRLWCMIGVCHALM